VCLFLTTPGYLQVVCFTLLRGIQGLVLALPIEAVPLKVCNNFGSSISGLDEVKGLRMVYTTKVADLAEPMALYFAVLVRST
jgi:hypothetical protein